MGHFRPTHGALRGITGIQHLDGSKGDPAGRQRPSSSTPIVDVHSGAMDLRQTSEYRRRTSASKKKKKKLSLRFTSTFHLTHPNSLYGQGLRQAKTPPKANLPITEVVNKSPRKIFKSWQTRKSLSSHIPDPSGSERKPLQLFYGIVLPLMPKTLCLLQVPIF
ncbi:hypothetical protein AVEN_147540-1 [Araneus ventricosus]|uniref:Uncharacterized protein n=1 Tax=Araneus ventricosus TaxID=182803 RepID=A0A4Y2QC63_ARAVE|nr:hypothetical protein AVEN_147540-1 [Araneus ventricosus]